MSCQSSRRDEDTCSWIFFQSGALGLEIENLSEQEISIKASFAAKDFSADNLSEINRQLKQAKLDRPAKTLSVENIADQDWMTNWKKYFQPFTVGESFIICPPWRTNEIKHIDLSKRKKILIDPGMAFGTGQHATTGFCLQAIEHWARGPRIMDVGTGSGILAIACALFMAKSSILALDIDDNAINNARQNIKLNNVAKRIELEQMSPEVFCSDAAKLSRFNTLLANLTAEDIVSLLATFDRLLSDDGVLILAGIIEEKSAMLESALAQYPLKTLEKNIDRGWIGMVLAKSSIV